MPELTLDEKQIIDFVQSHEMEMTNLSPELQRAIEAMRDGLVQRGTPIGKIAAGTEPVDGAMMMQRDGKMVRLTAFECGFLFGRLYEKKKVAAKE
jgi:hypothetical protein